MARKILVIEDDPDICELLSLHLGDYGYAVACIADGEEGYAQAASGDFDLIILDLMLPGMNGLEICSRLRAGHTYTPILMLAAKSSEVDRTVVLETGADGRLQVQARRGRFSPSSRHWARSGWTWSICETSARYSTGCGHR